MGDIKEKMQQKCPPLSSPVSVSTPVYSLRPFPSVYPPSEDTFLLMDALEADVERLRQLRPTLVVEVGTGSGAVSVFLRQLLLRPSETTTTSDSPYFISLCTDLNPEALHCTRETARLNPDPLLVTKSGMKRETPESRYSFCSPLVETVRCNLLDPLFFPANSNRVGGGPVDVLLFNPPYVPTPDDEIDHANNISLCWAGGRTGRAALDALMPRVPQLLSRRKHPNGSGSDGGRGGVFYVVAVAENDIAEMRRRNAELGLSTAVVLQRRCANERLCVLRIEHANAGEENRKMTGDDEM